MTINSILSNRKCSDMWIISLVLFCTTSLCIAAKIESTVLIRSVGLFVRQPEGTVAFVPGATRKEDAEEAVHFAVLPHNNRCYRIRRQPKYYFIVNHRADDPDAITYLGVQIVSIYEPSITVQDPIYVYRNENWKREEDKSFIGNTAKKKAKKVELSEFLERHKENALLEDLDRFLDFKWHGKPVGSSIDSWDLRQRWIPEMDLSSDAFRNEFEPPLDPRSKLMINGLLLRFTASKNPISGTGVGFWLYGRRAHRSLSETVCSG